MISKSRVIVLVHTSSAEGCISLELLYRWLSPSSEPYEVRERRATVVVCVPQLLRCHAGAVVPTSKYGLPHVLRSIDSWLLSVGFDPVDNLSEEGAVSVVVGSPPAAGARVCLDIDPDHSIEVGRDGSDHLVNLRGGRLSSAWEHVDVGDKSCSFSIL